MSTLDQLPPTYEPQSVEPEIRRIWAKSGCFHADPAANLNEAYTIVIPPPNVTGALHGGHALNNTLQDILIRWRRMQGYNTLWMPGTDHAGIATQAVVEKRIFETERKSRHDLGREEMVRRIWEWKEQYGNRIIEQLKLMGCSCDWDRTRFTLDEVCARAVRHTFFKLFKDGLIVRGKRLVNWDTHLQTAVADDEVYHETIQGHFWHFKYPVKDPRPGEPTHVHIATTRPETMLGDTAVAVHPEPDKALDKAEAELREKLGEVPDKEKRDVQAAIDEIVERRKTVLPLLLKLRDMARDGRKLILPLVDREIPLICDVWAKPELGSGCVKITPAHDANDYEVGQRQGLPMINVMTPDGRVARIIEPDGSVNPNSGKYEGLRFATEARKKVVADLEALGLVEKIEDRIVEIGHSDRSKTPIEPFLSDQWFVRMGDLPADEAAKIEGLRGSRGLAQLAMDAVCEKQHASAAERKACGKVHFFPERYAKTYLDWLGEKRDWCISRQLWWGHRIPVWSKGGRLPDQLSDATVRELAADSANIEWTGFTVKAEWRARIAMQSRIDPQSRTGSAYACVAPDNPEIEASLESNGYVQDPDVLDTWFSSALWPHSTLGWPAPNPLLPEADRLLDRYYPGSVLSTAREIITLWVARMVLTGRYNIGQVPFHDVYIHAVIQDGQGRPFKKTLGNGFDPVDIIEAYGADALRFTMANLSTETQDVRMPMKKVKLDNGREVQTSERFELGRNFCNKIWNAARFAFMNLGTPPSPPSTEGGSSEGFGSQSHPVDKGDANQSPPLNKGGQGGVARLDVASLPIEDRWILSQVSRAAVEVQDALEKFQFSRASILARDFFWDCLCDWYLELVKPRVRDNRRADEARQVLAFALDQSLRLLHPFIPFITERLWRQLNEIVPTRGLPGIAELDAPAVLATACYPPADGWKGLSAPDADAVFDDLRNATRAIREIRQNQNVALKDTVDVVIRVPAQRVESLRHEAQVIKQMARVGALTIGADAERPPNAATLVIGDMQIFVANVIDPAAERKRLEKDLAGLDKQIAGIEGKLSNAGFVERAPTEVVQRERDRLAELRAKRKTVLATMNGLE
ncbi:MAG: valine--tRNA ligase [Phycisphaerae bacterium]